MTREPAVPNLGSVDTAAEAEDCNSPVLSGSRTARPRVRAVLGAAAVLALGVAAASCGSGGGSEPAEQEELAEGESLTITTFGEFGYDKLIEEWNAEHPDVQVKQTKVSVWDDWRSELLTNLQAGSGLPDVAAVGGDFMPAMIASPDSWVDLSSDQVEGRWLEFVTDRATTDDGKLLGYGTDSGPEAICYRADLLEKAGLPSDREEVAQLMTTWDDYFALGEQFVAQSDAAWYDSSNTLAAAMLPQLANPFEKDDNTVDVETPELQELWTRVTGHADTLSTGNVWFSDDWSASFRKDGFATIPCPGWMRSIVRDNTGEQTGGVRWDIADVFPQQATNWGGSYLVVPQTSTHQELATELAAWLTAPEQQLRVYQEYGNFPSQVEALDDPALVEETDPYFNEAPVGQIFSEQAKQITVQPHIGTLYTDIFGYFQNAVSRVDQGTSPEESWQAFVRDVGSLQ